MVAPTRIKIATMDEIAPGEMKSCEIGGILIVVVNVADNFHAFQAVCPHKGGPLQEGVLDQELIECPWHHHRFDVRTGENVYPKNVYPKSLKKLQDQLKPLRTFPIKVEGRDIILDLV